MLTRSRLKRGEGVIETLNPNIRRPHRREKMADEEYKEEDEKAFRKTFYQKVNRVEKLFANYQEVGKEENKEGESRE